MSVLEGYRREYRGLSLHFDVTDAGSRDGEPVVLLHGFPQDRSSWAALSPRFHEAGYRTLALDQRGYSPGARPRGRFAYRRPELVGDVVALLDAAGLTSAHVVGHDWGSVVGWALADDHADRVRTLTALSVPHPSAYLQAMRTGRQAPRSAYIAFFQLPAAPERMLLAEQGARLRQLLVRSGLPAEQADRYVERMREPGALSAALAWYRSLPWALSSPVGRIQVPTLHVWGARDPAIDREGPERTGDLVDARYRYEVLGDVGHWLPETAAERLAPLVLAHLRG